MKIIYLGMNKIGKLIHDWLISQGENIVAVLTEKSELPLIFEHTPDLVISGGFRHIVSKKYLKIPRLGCINMHKSLLPHNRGANPNFWTILNNTPAGVSIHFMDSGIDTGPILAQRKVVVEFKDTARTLYDKLQDAQLELFKEFWPRFKNGVVEAKQQPGGDSYHEISDFTKLRRIDLHKTYRAEDMIRLLRAMSFKPFKNCYFEINNKRYFLHLEIEEGIIDSEKIDKASMVRQYDE